jgi:hypothetical protein
VESLKKLTKVSSAQLAASNHYMLDENGKAEHLRTALHEFTACPNGLTVPDLKALVTAATNSTDSPVKKRKEELQQQL